LFNDYINPDGTFKPEFYDEDYYERGPESGKGWLENYHWMPRRTFKEAFAFIDYMGLDDSSYVLEFGCSKGFLVRAMRMLNIRADGCDISKYALSFAPTGCWDCSKEEQWEEHSSRAYSHIIAKDVFEHLNPNQLEETLIKLSGLAKKIMCVVPIGDSGIYRIPEYHTEISHLIAEDETWWMQKFEKAGWVTAKHCDHLPGLKDNWMSTPKGNHVFVIDFI
jgi:cyclopropane fatty-acyl-phospholipid synthase-like methyltransferase